MDAVVAYIHSIVDGVVALRPCIDEGFLLLSPNSAGCRTTYIVCYFVIDLPIIKSVTVVIKSTA